MLPRKENGQEQQQQQQQKKPNEVKKKIASEKNTEQANGTTEHERKRKKGRPGRRARAQNITNRNQKSRKETNYQWMLCAVLYCVLFNSFGMLCDVRCKCHKEKC